MLLLAEHTLLQKYMKLVKDFSGTTFVELASLDEFTEGEFLELQKLDQNIYENSGSDWTPS
jgi:hypothetical protein